MTDRSEKQNGRNIERVAKCACGSTTITVRAEPVVHAVCHCDGCKKRTGSAFGVSAYFQKQDAMSFAGETSVYSLHNTARNEDQQRHFCKQCGTTLYWYTSMFPTFVGIAAGCFADDPLGEPNVSASHSKKIEWVTVPELWKISA